MNMHKRNLLVSALALPMLLVAGSAFAQQNQDTASASASVEIVEAITITTVNNLHFGDVVAGATAGTVVVTDAGVRSATGGVTLGQDTDVAPATFTVTGDADGTYTIALPSSTTITSGADNMTVDVFTSNPDGTGTLPGGTATLSVGATLNVGDSQPSGTYTGTFDVTVAYE